MLTALECQVVLLFSHLILASNYLSLKIKIILNINYVLYFFS
ncbi:hypothetical protein PTUN_a2365 [Pseudoalteromonas tunicata]|uniref:Uncharacterized protein n=1 Tax=Pseudoalteromonas tunicata D2 TaxID=87626 RepID=A4CA97_9GAMM|nr:hypothetical protein PTUN_a2365 [Pseudoalteromonas tunicata]EAR28305.1 hypothetical protein PTD2_20857 [Pseudoalteromonas tunicata D2]